MIVLQVTLYSVASGKRLEDVVQECVGLDTKGFKTRLAGILDAHLAPIRERYENILQRPQQVIDILVYGSDKARKRAVETMKEVKQIVGLDLHAPCFSL